MGLVPPRPAAALAVWLLVISIGAAQEKTSFARRNPVTGVNAFDLERSLWETKPGDRVQFTVDRQGKSLVVELTLGASTGAGHAARIVGAASER